MTGKGIRRFVPALLMAAALLVGCSDSETLRYRLTVEVETPQGTRSGSSVIEVLVLEQRGETYIGNQVRLRARGEAPAVDLPNGQVLFALLRSETQVDAANVYPWYAFNPPCGEGHEWGVYAARWMRERELSGPLPKGRYPMLVTFGDLNDPTSVAKVAPDNLAASFGEGVSLKRITVELTDDPVTTGIEERLGWLQSLWPNNLNSDRFEDFDKPELAARLSPNSFSTEIGK